VEAISVWPRRSETTFRFTPEEMRFEAKV